jgi:hypothetical protein
MTERRTMLERLPRVRPRPQLVALEIPSPVLRNADENPHLAAALLIVGERARVDALARTPAQCVSVLAQCARPWDRETTITVWSGGTYDTDNGQRHTMAVADLATYLGEYAAEACEKGAGTWFSPALSLNGGCRDADAEAITQLILDCDLAGDWNEVRAALDASGLAYVLQRSSSHTARTPRWHVHVFLAQHVRGLTKAQWRAIYRHAVAWFSVVAGLQSDPRSRHLKFRYGFDAKPDRMVQPWFAPARRTDDQSAPELIFHDGAALDICAFLKTTGLNDESALAEAASLSKKNARAPTRDSATAVSAPATGVVMQRAAAYLAKMPASVAGQGGDDALFNAACALVRGFGLDPEVAREMLQPFNARCRPPWEVGRLEYKIRQAYFRSTRPFGYVLTEKGVDAAIRRILARRDGRQA